MGDLRIHSVDIPTIAAADIGGFIFDADAFKGGAGCGHCLGGALGFGAVGGVADSCCGEGTGLGVGVVV